MLLLIEKFGIDTSVAAEYNHFFFWTVFNCW